MSGNDVSLDGTPRLWVIGKDTEGGYLLTPVGEWKVVQRHPRPLGICIWKGEHDFEIIPNLHSVLSIANYLAFDEVPAEQTKHWLHDFIGYTNEDYEKMTARVRDVLAQREAHGTTRSKYPARAHDDKTADDDVANQ